MFIAVALSQQDQHFKLPGGQRISQRLIGGSEWVRRIVKSGDDRLDRRRQMLGPIVGFPDDD